MNCKNNKKQLENLFYKFVDDIIDASDCETLKKSINLYIEKKKMYNIAEDIKEMEVSE